MYILYYGRYRIIRAVQIGQRTRDIYGRSSCDRRRRGRVSILLLLGLVQALYNIRLYVHLYMYRVQLTLATLCVFFFYPLLQCTRVYIIIRAHERTHIIYVIHTIALSAIKIIECVNARGINARFFFPPSFSFIS